MSKRRSARNKGKRIGEYLRRWSENRGRHPDEDPNIRFKKRMKRFDDSLFVDRPPEKWQTRYEKWFSIRKTHNIVMFWSGNQYRYIKTLDNGKELHSIIYRGEVRAIIALTSNTIAWISEGDSSDGVASM